MKTTQAALAHPDRSWRRNTSLRTMIIIQIQITQAKRIMFQKMFRNGYSAAKTMFQELLGSMNADDPPLSRTRVQGGTHVERRRASFGLPA